MGLLLLSVLLILTFGSVYLVITRKPRRVARRFSWRRLVYRTLDWAVINRSGLACLMSVPIVIFVALAFAFGLNLTGPGFLIAGVVSLALVPAVVWRGSKWMERAWRPTRDWLRERKAKRASR
jgi:hypothetical protein